MTRNLYLIPKNSDMSIVCSKYNLDVSIYPNKYFDTRAHDLWLIERQIGKLISKVPDTSNEFLMNIYKKQINSKCVEGKQCLKRLMHGIYEYEDIHTNLSVLQVLLIRRVLKLFNICEINFAKHRVSSLFDICMSSLVDKAIQTGTINEKMPRQILNEYRNQYNANLQYIRQCKRIRPVSILEMLKNDLDTKICASVASRILTLWKTNWRTRDLHY